MSLLGRVTNAAQHANLNAFVALSSQGSRLNSVKDASLRTTPTSLLQGKSIAIKDNICTTDLPTTCASNILRDFTSPYNATVVEDLMAAGAVIAGKTNMDEFGMGSHSTHTIFGPVAQIDATGTQRSAGGSSGGSAIAVSTDQCYAALGTDTGGSVRLPAAYTGIVGFKPSYGLISRHGVIAYANSLDTVGIMAKSTNVVKELFDLLNKHDERDPTSLQPSTRSRLPNSTKEREQFRIGVPKEYNIDELATPVRTAWLGTLKRLQACGHHIQEVSLPATRQALSAYYVLAPAEASSNLAKYDGVRYGTRSQSAARNDGVLYSGTRGRGFGAEVRRRILLGAYTLSAAAMDNYFIQAQRVRRIVQREFDAVLARRNPLHSEYSAPEDGVDFLICPTAPTLPPTLEEIQTSTPLDAYVNDVFTVPASLAGLPAISVPSDVEQAEPAMTGHIGMQIIGQYGDDHRVLAMAAELERLRS